MNSMILSGHSVKKVLDQFINPYKTDMEKWVMGIMQQTPQQNSSNNHSLNNCKNISYSSNA